MMPSTVFQIMKYFHDTAITEDRDDATSNTELPSVKFVDCSTISLLGHDRCMVIVYPEQNLTEYAGLNLRNGDEGVMGGELFDTSMTVIADSGMSFVTDDDGKTASVSILSVEVKWGSLIGQSFV